MNKTISFCVSEGGGSILTFSTKVLPQVSSSTEKNMFFLSSLNMGDN